MPPSRRLAASALLGALAACSPGGGSGAPGGSTGPQADFAGDPRTGPAPLAVLFADESSGTITEWSWAFGDGGTASEADPAHTYLAPGSYAVTLAVSGPDGADSLTRDDYIVVVDPPPVAGFSGAPRAGAAPLDVAFTDESTGAITAWSWIFGDGGTAGEADPGHTYVAPGTYTVALAVAGPGGSDALTRDDYIVVVDPPPVAGFSGAPRAGAAPLDVAFTDESTGAITAWSWVFGDGGTSSLRHPVHRYETAGTYTVSLEVTGPGGSDALQRSDYIVVDPPPCPPPSIASFQTFADVSYAPGRFLDAYVPDEPRICSPTLVWVHGGGWIAGSKNAPESRALVRAVAADGWYVVVIDYTLADFDPCGSGLGAGSYPEAYRDVKRAVDWIRSAGTLLYQLPDEIVVAGSSAGATLAAMTGMTLGVGEDHFDPAPGGDYRVDRVILFSAAMNFVKGGCFGNPWTGICVANCPAPPDPPQDCSLPAGCESTGGYAPGYPCLADSGNCRGFEQPECFLGTVWPAGGVPAGVECGSPLGLPPHYPALPTGNPWYDASPYFWVTGEEPPFHVFASECDPLVPLADAVDLVAALAKVGVPVELLLTPTLTLCDEGCRHGADAITGEDAAGALIAVLVAAYVP
ncbi:MAG: PKD domain-containing protein [Planctomycetota bacterium]